MGVIELAKIKISNRLGSIAKTFKNLTIKGGRSTYQKKDYSGFLLSNLKFKKSEQVRIKCQIFLLLCKNATPCLVYHEIVRNF
jgi:two-component sensor histidine kinase